MRFTTQRVRITGFTITESGPIGRVFIPATEEMMVLYGINGAGKSTLLEAIVAGLKGATGGAEVHLAVDRPFERGDLGSMADDLIRALLRAGAGLMNSALDEIGHLHRWDPAEYGLPESTAIEYRNPGAYFLDDNNLGAAVEAQLLWELPDGSPLSQLPAEIAAQGLFTLRPIGDDGVPLWRLFVSAVEDETAPTTRQYLAWCREQWAAWHLDGGDSEDAEVVNMELLENGPAPEDFRGDLAFGVDRPAWVPHAIEDFGVLEAEPGLFPAGLVSEGFDPVAATLSYLEGRHGEPSGLIAAMDEESLVLHPHVESRLIEVVDRANKILRLLVDDAPVVELTVNHPNEWLYGAQPIEWGALDLPSLHRVGLQSLSSFQRRWAAFAIGLAAQSPALNGDLRDVFLIVDEPERAAHPRALAHLSKGLAMLGEEYGARVVVASHAADFLSSASARLMHVRRDSQGFGVATPLVAPLAADLAEVQSRLGIGPADVLQLIRVFLIVEGQHDVGVINAMVGDALREHRVHLMAMRGTHNLLTLLDSQFLTTFTDATFVVALDRTSMSKVRRAMDSLRQACDQSIPMNGRPRLMQKALEPLQNGTSEERALSELLQALARSGTLERFEVHGLSKPDIIEYLPVADFVPDATSWAEAKKSWPRGTDFKGWLRSLGATVSAKSLEAIASRVDLLPKDFTELVETCERATRAR